MSFSGDHVLEQGLSLPPAERIRIAAELMRSVQSATESAIDAAWAEEADLRLERFLADNTRAVPADSAIDQASDWLRSQRG